MTWIGGVYHSWLGVTEAPDQKNLRKKSLTAYRAEPSVNRQLEPPEDGMRRSIAFSRQFSAVLAFLTVLVMPALAGPNRWTGSGPGLASVARVITDPSNATRLYAVTTAGSVLKSTDGGLTWRSANQGLPSQSITAFLVEPGSTTTLFLAIGGDIFVSTDGADHWVRAGTIAGTIVRAMAFDAGSHLLYAGTEAGLYVSGDNGKTWSLTGLSAKVSSIVVSPKSTVFATGDSGLLRSYDHGRTWSLIRSGSDGLVVVDQNSTVYWFPDDPLSPNGPTSASSDEGATWRNLAFLPTIPQLSNVSIAAPGDLVALASQGLFEYTDQSGAWVPVGPPITNGSPLSMAIVPSQPRKFVVSTTGGGVLIGEGADWTHVTDGFAGARANDVAVVASTPSVAVAATDSGLFRTEDRGIHWNEITPAGSLQSTAVQVDPSRTDVLYASTGQLYKSTDSGSSWKMINASGVKLLSISPTDPATIYAAWSDNLQMSKNSGESWSQVNFGLDMYNFVYSGGAFTSIDEDPTNGNTVYIGTSLELYRIAPDGSSRGIAGVMRALAIAPGESVVYAAPSTGGVLKSGDRGATWTTAGLIDKNIEALILTGVGRNILYAASADGHVYRTTNAGTTWQGVDTALDRASIARVASDPSGKFLYAATATGVRHYEVVDIQVDALPNDSLRFPELLNRALGNSMAILPVTGTATGASGIVYTTDITLANARDSVQDIIATWLPEAAGGATSFHIFLPPSSDASNGVVTIPDFAQSFGLSGVGSLVITGVNASGNADPNASISATADIWSRPAGPRAPFSQSVKGVPRQMAFSHTVAEVTGLQHDAAFRSNIGIANLSGEAHRYAVHVTGERATKDFTMSVLPFSLLQVPLPEMDYGALTVTITADASTDWVAYGSTLDRITGEARTNTQN